MNNYTAIGRAEGFIEATPDEQLEAWQYLIDTGLVWTLQGWFGRVAVDLLNSGVCTAPSNEDNNESAEPAS